MRQAPVLPLHTVNGVIFKNNVLDEVLRLLTIKVTALMMTRPSKHNKALEIM